MEFLTNISFKDDLGIDLTNPAQFAMRVKGKSDIPGIFDGDILFVDRKFNLFN